MNRMTRKLLKWTGWILLLVLLLAPTAALAQRDEVQRTPIDARLEGYKTNVTLEGNSTALTWVLLIVLGAIVFTGLFKDAKRSHLD